MIPERDKCLLRSKRCMCPPRQRPSQVWRPKISAVIGRNATTCAMARRCGRWVALIASSDVRCAQIAAATGSWPAAGRPTSALWRKRATASARDLDSAEPFTLLRVVATLADVSNSLESPSCSSQFDNDTPLRLRMNTTV